MQAKMMQKLGSDRIIDWVLTRLQQVSNFDLVALATTSKRSDDVLAAIAADYGLEVFRGDEDDVLSRFVGAAKHCEANLVARVCCDNPFVDPVLIDTLVDQFVEDDDLVFNHRSYAGYEIADGFGGELFSLETLLDLDRAVSEMKIREHVTLGVYEGLVERRWRGVEVPQALRLSNLKFDVDSEGDLRELSRFVLHAKISKGDDSVRIVESFWDFRNSLG